MSQSEEAAANKEVAEKTSNNNQIVPQVIKDEQKITSPSAAAEVPVAATKDDGPA